MGGSTFGERFKITTFGESHGAAVGVIVEGVTPGVEIDEAYIQKQMDRRKPGQSSVTTPRKEYDIVQIQSGVFEGKTTGTPLMVILYNHDMKPEAYSDIQHAFRPGHADYTYLQKYGIRDHRGSGRASGRETAARVAGGAVARKLLERRGVQVLAYTREIGGIACRSFQEEVIEENAVRACDPEAAARMIERIEELARRGDSCGGIVECRIRGVQPGLGEPVFDKLDAELAKAMLSIGAVKGIEFGAGFAAASMLGSEHNDGMSADGFLSNHAGGILGGISTGEEIVFRISVKPTSSISVSQRTVNVRGEEQEIRTEGRHDPCICPRIVPVVEAMACLVVEDHYKRQAALLG
ncbi:chorismate synthase [Paenibacillus mucilaginosus]|uniref:Chorismate synthase n=3 Tax=Paenibacillus mucilaginosus TaxID=61624 RepID=H6NA95_9BACL|nr:chorismate synthase [Paenibacillus mucilaginosus]AEI40734.1 chorismate synthase [Paenibacillus mucilaginosus KNP414]AFC29341.1 chorismate synthase [Paenibacillus mucilaginosus 3016]AFH61521.1 chorismate synthase [Paenibacillus mucilaginosus K02]MCG7211785.1 chorismate synthase [Paenibacillus mucilaginosus]WDM29863.1 chorismate synthase [Paenibacillus mucilaginosus]